MLCSSTSTIAVLFVLGQPSNKRKSRSSGCGGTSTGGPKQNCHPLHVYRPDFCLLGRLTCCIASRGGGWKSTFSMTLGLQLEHVG